MDYQAFKQLRRREPQGYGEFLKGIAPGEVKPWPIPEGAKVASVRSAMWAAAVRLGITIETVREGDTLWVARPPEETAPPPAPGPKPRGKRS